MNIPKRIIITFLAMMLTIVFLAATGYFGFTSMCKKMAAFEEISRDIETVIDLNLYLHEAVSYLNNYLVTGDPDERRNYKKISTEIKELFEKAILVKPGADASLENAKRLYANIDRMSEELFKYEVPLDNKDAVTTMSEIHQTADWISRLYIEIHQIKNRQKLEKITNEAAATRKWIDRVQITGAVIAVIIGLYLIIYNIKTGQPLS